MRKPPPNESADPQLRPVSCPDCQAGVLHLQYLTYFTQVDGELITVPNFPAWVCDICGYREDDSRAENWLHILLNPRTGRRSLRRPGQHPPRSDRKSAQP